MGRGTLNADDINTYANYAKSAPVRSATAAAALSNPSFHADLNPRNFHFRESRDSAGNPKSTPVILGLDVTGSMGDIALQIHKHALGTLITNIFERKPVSDPHIAFAGIGDVRSDIAPLQISQFESNIVMLDELKKLWIEGNGGGNGWESYNLPWHFALTRTQCDAFSHGRKGYIFTFGDEEVPADLTVDDLVKVYGPGEHLALDNNALLTGLAANWHVFHLMVEQGHHMRYAGGAVKAQWTGLLGERAIPLADYTKLAEVIVSLMEATAGKAKEDIVNSWTGDTSLVVAQALAGYTGTTEVAADAGLVRF